MCRSHWLKGKQRLHHRQQLCTTVQGPTFRTLQVCCSGNACTALVLLTEQQQQQQQVQLLQACSVTVLRLYSCPREGLPAATTATGIIISSSSSSSSRCSSSLLLCRLAA
jgi:hypothetical protein